MLNKNELYLHRNRNLVGRGGVQGLEVGAGDDYCWDSYQSISIKLFF